MPAFYSEFDPKAAAWLRELIKRGLIADGVVDERDLWDVAPDDLRDFTQVHLCAGIGVWSYALRRAGWPDDRPVWTASFPCQPFSAAGKGLGFADERHLWPAGEHLIRECGPRVLFGEQVASKDAEPWLDAVQNDLEALGYAFGACAFPSAGIGAPHIRDRTYWVADAPLGRRGEERSHAGRQPVGDSAEGLATRLEHGRNAGRLADDDDEGLERRRQPGRERAVERLVGAGGMAGGLANAGSRGLWWGHQHRDDARTQGEVRGETRQQWIRPDCSTDSAVGGLADADGRQRDGQPVLRGAERDGPDAGRSQGSGQSGARRLDSGLVDADGAGRQQGQRDDTPAGHRPSPAATGQLRNVGGHADPHGAGAQGEHGLREVAPHAGPVNGGWADADWIYCRNGEWRPVEPGTFPLAHGAPARVGRLRGYGNAVNASAAQAWVESYLEAREDQGA